MSTLKAVLGFILFLIAAVILFVYSGIYNIAADEPHRGPVRWLLETTRINSVDKRADQVNVPLDLAASTRIQKGAASYAAMCQVCHLGPGVEPTPLHQGLNPMPPRLDEEVPHHSPGNLFWIVKHGFKMSAMPAWGTSHSDQELWDIVAFLQKLPELTPQEYKNLTEARGGPGHGH